MYETEKTPASTDAFHKTTDKISYSKVPNTTVSIKIKGHSLSPKFLGGSNPNSYAFAKILPLQRQLMFSPVHIVLKNTTYN